MERVVGVEREVMRSGGRWWEVVGSGERWWDVMGSGRQ